MCAEQKQQKISEIKAAVDDADVLVLCRKYQFYFLAGFPKFMHVTSFFL